MKDSIKKIEMALWSLFILILILSIVVALSVITIFDKVEQIDNKIVPTPTGTLVTEVLTVVPTETQTAIPANTFTKEPTIAATVIVMESPTPTPKVPPYFEEYYNWYLDKTKTINAVLTAYNVNLQNGDIENAKQSLIDLRIVTDEIISYERVPQEVSLAHSTFVDAAYELQVFIAVEEARLSHGDTSYRNPEDVLFDARNLIEQSQQQFENSFPEGFNPLGG